MADTYLTREELKTLTGLAQGKRQCAWLKNAGWTFVTNARGRPQVLRAYHDARLNGAKTTGPATEPNRGVFHERKAARAGRTAQAAV